MPQKRKKPRSLFGGPGFLPRQSSLNGLGAGAPPLRIATAQGSRFRITGVDVPLSGRHETAQNGLWGHLLGRCLFGLERHLPNSDPDNRVTRTRPA